MRTSPLLLAGLVVGYLAGRARQIDAERTRRLNLAQDLGLRGAWDGATVTPIDREKVRRHG